MKVLDEILGQGADRPIAVIHNVEWAHSLDGKLENLRRPFDCVVAYLTLAYVYKNSAVHPVLPNPDAQDQFSLCGSIMPKVCLP